jgi:hypothetical protein
MTYRVLALTVAAGLSLAPPALAKPDCPTGEFYHRSKHTCIAKTEAINLGLYHSGHHSAAKADGTTVVHRSTRARAAALPAAAPLPPVRLVGDGTASAPLRDKTVDSTGSVAPTAPVTALRSLSPYGALVPVTPAE